MNFFKMHIFFDADEYVRALTQCACTCVFNDVKRCYLIFHMTSNSVEHDMCDINCIILRNYGFVPHFGVKMMNKT